MPAHLPPLAAAPFDGLSRAGAPAPAANKRTTDRTLAALKPRAEAYDFKTDAPGLYVRVMAHGARIFRLLQKRYDPARARRATAVTTLGEWPAFTLAEARRQAWARAGRINGPTERLTVADALARFFSAHESGAHAWRRATVVAYGGYRRALAGAVGARPLAEVRRAELSELLRRYATTRGPVAANRLSSFCTSFWRWSRGEGLTEADLTATLGTKQRQPGGDEQSRERVLSDAEIRSLWALDYPHANLLRALLLTGCRIAELQRATTARLDGEWLTIPPEHAKNGKAHRVFIVPEMRAQFDGGAPLLFRAVSPTAVQAWLKRRAPDPARAWTPHDLRRTFATLAARAGVAPHVIVALLNQTGADSRLSATLAVYMRHDYADERKAATVAVRDLVLAIVHGR
jgi:integrase